MLEVFKNKAPMVSDRAFVHHSACVCGDVRIGDYSVIRANSSIIGDDGTIIIGAKTVVEENCVLHVGNFSDWEKNLPGKLLIGKRVIVGHGAVVHAKQIGNRVLIGMNSTVLEGVEIGDDCIIAAGAVVKEGSIIPDRSFVAGVPATIKGQVSDKQLRWISDGEKLSDAYFKEIIEQLRAASQTS